MGNFLLASSQYGTRFYRDRYNTPETSKTKVKQSFVEQWELCKWRLAYNGLPNEAIFRTHNNTNKSL